MDEMQAIQKNLSSGQQEKQDLMQVGDWGEGGGQKLSGLDTGYNISEARRLWIRCRPFRRIFLQDNKRNRISCR